MRTGRNQVLAWLLVALLAWMAFGSAGSSDFAFLPVAVFEFLWLVLVVWTVGRFDEPDLHCSPAIDSFSSRGPPA